MQPSVDCCYVEIRYKYQEKECIIIRVIPLLIIKTNEA